MTNITMAGIYFVLLIIVSITTFFAFVRDRHKQVTKHLIRLCLITIGWQVAQALFFIVNNEAFALWIFDVKLVFVAFAPVQLLLLSVKFYNSKLSRTITLIFALLCIIPSITAVLAITAPFHHLLRTELFVEQMMPLRVLTNVRGPWFWVHSGYSYILMFASIIYIFYQHTKLPKGFRVPSVLVAVGSIIAFFSNVLVLFTTYFADIDVTLVGISIGLIFTYAGIAISDESSLLVQALDNIFDYLEDYIFILNAKRSIIEMNPAAIRWLRAMKIDYESRDFDKMLAAIVVDGDNFFGENSSRKQDFHLAVDGKISHYNINERPIIDQSGKQIGNFNIITDITRYKNIIERVEEAAGIDALTGLGNRRSYDQMVIKAEESDILPFSVILGDVNGLKTVNDTMGHAAGDALLRTVGQALPNACPKDCGVYRIGGDEFVLFLPHMSRKDAEDVVENIRGDLERLNGQFLYTVSIALGIATKETKEQSLLECIAQADKVMYMDKQNNRRNRPG